MKLRQQCETLLCRTTRRRCTKAGFRIELCGADYSELLKELVDTDLTVLGKLSDAGVFILWKSDCQGLMG